MAPALRMTRSIKEKLQHFFFTVGRACERDNGEGKSCIRDMATPVGIMEQSHESMLLLGSYPLFPHSVSVLMDSQNDGDLPKDHILLRVSPVHP